MSAVLMTSMPAQGHVGPTCAVAAHLAQRGHDVRVLTGTRFRERVERTGARFLPLPPEADAVDLDSPDPAFLAQAPPGVRGLAWALEHLFVSPLSAEYDAVVAALAAEPAVAVVTDMLFLGAYPLASLPRRQRPAVVLLGISPIAGGGGGTASFGVGAQPMGGPLGWLRNTALRVALRRLVFAGVEKRIASEFHRAVGRRPAGSLFELPLTVDAVAQLCPPGLEYPRPWLRTRVEFVGALRVASPDVAPPPWWGDLTTGRAGRHVVHVTQGTVKNDDFSRLVVPTVRALADRPDCLVVVTGGGRPEQVVTDALVAALGAVPANTRVAAFLDYAALLPLVDLLVSNGGYGTVTQALAHGIPLVLAGRSEDKAEVAARVAWAGAGIALRTDTPTPAALRRAVGRALLTPGYRNAARRLAAQDAACGGLDAVEALLLSS